MSNKYKLTNETKTVNSVTLYRIEAIKDFGNVKSGDKGGWIEKESNLSQENTAWVSGDAQVSGNAWVYGNAQVCGDARVYADAQVSGNARLQAKLAYTQGRFIGGMDGEDKVTNITSQTGTAYWDNQYVLGDYSIELIDEEAKKELLTDEIIELNGKKYKLINE